MLQKVIKAPMIEALVCNTDTPDYSPQNGNNMLLVGTKFESNYRAFMQFDLSSLPFFSVIRSGTLHLFVARNDFPASASSLGIFQIRSHWEPQTLTWNEQPLVSSSPVDSFEVNYQAATFLTFNVTSLLQDWFSNPSANLGLMVKFMNESSCNFLTIPGYKYPDCHFWPYLELNILDQAPLENHRMLCAIPLEQFVTVSTQPFIQFTLPANVLVYDYSYLVVNIGRSVARAYLQISPDGATWEDQSDTKVINPGTIVSFVPDVIAKYARLAYQSEPASPNTTLQIYIQGRS